MRRLLPLCPPEFSTAGAAGCKQHSLTGNEITLRAIKSTQTMPQKRAKQPAGDYTLRRATNANLPAVWTLISCVLRSYGITANPQTTDKDLADIEANYWNRKGAFFVLLDGREVIGTVALQHDTNAVCELCRMYLAPQYRGQGLGRRMLERAVREARKRGFKEMHLKTASVLVEVISLYKRAGFSTVVGAEAGGNCDLVMSRSLQ